MKHLNATQILSTVLAFFLPLFFLSCTTSGDGIEPGGNPAEGKRGYLIGQVTDHKGKGIGNAVIFTENTVFKNRGTQVTSTANGSYKMAMVQGLGQWTVRGYILTKYNGRTYKTFLHPDNSDSFTAEENPVRNFDWKIQGHIPDPSLNLYYGGSAELYRDLNSGIYDSENVEFTFRPDGPLIDGSAGKVLKLNCGRNGAVDYNVINDIPIGRYIVSAIYKPTGEALMVSDAWGEMEYHPSVTVNFFGTESSYRANQIGIGFTDQFQVGTQSGRRK